MLIDREVARSHALVVDANRVTRMALVQTLRNLGFRQVRQAQRVRDAREMLEVRRFDLVLCDHDIATGPEGGRSVIDELQRSQPLPLTTVCIMVAGEATYAKVVEAAESALDGYLVRPFTAQTLAERIAQARRKKRALAPVIQALEAGDLAAAARLCVERFDKREPYWLYAARLGAELLLRQQRAPEARQLCERVQQAQPQDWARLGVARAQLALGEWAAARRVLDQLLAAQADFADALDVLGQVQLEQAHPDDALATFARAARLTPDCVLRQQQCGVLAFLAGDDALAAEMLERAWAAGRRSRLLDAQTPLLLALLRRDRDTQANVAELLAALDEAAAAQPDSPRGRRLRDCAQAMAGMMVGAGPAGAATDAAGEAAAALGLARTLAQEHAASDFDVEAAVHVLALWVRLAARGHGQEEVEGHVRAIARRFCTSKAASELLARIAQPHPPAVGWVREEQGAVMHLAEEAMNQALHGDPAAAVQTLLQHGERTRNAKLIDMAVSVVRRHRERLADAPKLLGEAGALAHRYGQGPQLPRLRRQGRPPGGLALRG